MLKQSSYTKLKKIFFDVSAFESAMSILRWDAETYMKEGSRESRALELATLSNYKKKILSSTETLHLIEKAHTENLDTEDNLNLLEMEILVKESRSIPEKLNQKLIHAISKCETARSEAISENDISIFLPSFKELLNLTREKAEMKAEIFKLSLYDALIFEYDKNISEKFLDTLCVDLEKKLASLINNRRSTSCLNYNFHAKTHSQKHFTIRLLRNLKFDFNYGRFDETSHPFCEGHSEDIRLAINFDEKNFLNTLMSLMHEFGHALYDSRLPKKWKRQPLGKDAGMVIHEAQALLFEMMIGRSDEFIGFIFPLLEKYFHLDPSLDAKDISLELRKVNPGNIRIEADYVSYPAHIIMRYRLEQSLIYGELSPEDLPEAFNEYMFKLLGVKPTSLTNGVLQDVHWSSGYFGYFPCYLIGAIISALIYKNLKSDIKNLEEILKKASFEPIYLWLENHFYKHGRKINSMKILDELAGSKTKIADQYLGILEQY